MRRVIETASIVTAVSAAWVVVIIGVLWATAPDASCSDEVSVQGTSITLVVRWCDAPVAPAAHHRVRTVSSPTSG